MFIACAHVSLFSHSIIPYLFLYVFVLVDYVFFPIPLTVCSVLLLPFNFVFHFIIWSESEDRTWRSEMADARGCPCTLCTDEERLRLAPLPSKYS